MTKREDDKKLTALRAALIAGEESGFSEPFDLEDFLKAKRASRQNLAANSKKSSSPGSSG